jgi:IS30 family transposase
MGEVYSQLELTERIEIYRLHAGGKSLRAIAAALRRSASTISRELRRNAKPTKVWREGYEPVRAQRLAERRRRWDGRFKLMRQPDLRALVRDRLAMGWSPEQIAGRLTREQASARISHESIYRFIYHRSASKDYWHRLLPRAKHRRGRPGRQGGSPVDHINRRHPLSERPAEAADRRTAGHWEADFALFSHYGHSVLALHERASRMTLLRRTANRRAEPTVAAIAEQLAPLDPTLRRSISFDNGTEFARHYRLTDQLGIATFFCDPHSPWQKGGIENAIGRMRRILPRRTNLDTISDHHILAAAERLNHTPRKCLDFQTPAEAFSKLHSTVALQT